MSKRLCGFAALGVFVLSLAGGASADDGKADSVALHAGDALGLEIFGDSIATTSPQLAKAPVSSVPAGASNAPPAKIAPQER